jgi:hypothetical protein
LGSRPLARGLLEQLWDAAYEAGDEFIGDGTDVEAAAGWEGAPGFLTKALLEAGGDGHAGFIEEVPGKLGHYRVHHLWHHAPDYVRKRRQREDERRQKGDPVVPPTATRQPPTRDCPPHDGQQMPNLDCSDGVAFPPAPAPSPAPSPALPPSVRESERELEGQGGRGVQGSDDLIDEICGAHPRLQKPALTQQYIISALQEEIARGRTCQTALDYLRERTILYRELTSLWPEDQRRYVISSYEFFRTAEYRTDPKFWKKASNGGELRPAPLPSHEPVSERMRKEIAADLQTVQSEAEAGAKP